jgi:hypothetical protein
MGTGAAESAYEEARRRKIEENQAVMAQLGILDLARAVQAPAGACARSRAGKRTGKRSISSSGGSDLQRRSSRRIQGESAADADGAGVGVAGVTPAASKREAQVAQPPQQIWDGEQFGEVGVSVGTVFGAGDYQRQGRFEMAANGFFKPVVQPEWLDPHRGVQQYRALCDSLCDCPCTRRPHLTQLRVVLRARVLSRRPVARLTVDCAQGATQSF